MLDRVVNINKNARRGVSFAPSPIQALKLALITWTNNDDQPHWPAPAVINNDVLTILKEDGFMPTRIAAGGQSDGYVVEGDPRTITYGCVLHPDKKSERGEIEVLAEPPSLST